MKKIYLVIIVLLATVLVACSNNENKPPLVSLYDLTFMLDEETVYHSFKVELEGPMLYPANPVKEGYIFDGWFVGETQYTAATVSASALTLYARFTEISGGTYLVRFYDDTTLISSVEIEQGNTLGSHIPSTSKTGYIFNGWYTDSNLTTAFNTSNPITTSLNLYGKWTEYDDNYTYTGYYESINGLSGPALVDALYDLLNDTGTYSTTTYGQARYILEESDIWVGYNTDYMYLIYTDTLRGSAGGGFQFDGYGVPIWNVNNDGTNSTWNREHVWAKSLFGTGNYDPGVNTRGIDADMHNLRAADTNVNSSRGNNKFINQVYNPSGFGNYSGQWYPGDNHRGDVARILFYMDVRWGNMTNLSLIGDLDTLIAWHEADPVDDFEIHRNNVIYGYQNNRNPFIDHEELAYKIWAPEKLALSFSESYTWNYIPGLSFNTIFV